MKRFLDITGCEVKPNEMMQPGDRVKLGTETFSVLQRIWQPGSDGRPELVIDLDWPAR